MIHFKQRLLPNYLPHDLEIVTVNGGEGTSQYHIELAVAKSTGKRKKMPSRYFIATPRILRQCNGKTVAMNVDDGLIVAKKVKSMCLLFSCVVT